MKRLALILALALAGCQTQPTKVTETQTREFYQVVGKAQKPIELTDNTVILDARSSFDYGLNRVQNSQHFTWDKLAELASTGEVLRDKRQAGLRMALTGLEPETPVVVVGYGLSGQGEEGRLAWTLLYLGFQDVQVSGIETFRKSWTQVASPPARNVPMFPVHPREQMRIGRDELLQLAKNSNHTVFVDVRSAKEFAQKSEGLGAGVHAVNVEWKQFYTAQGRPDWRFTNKLQEKGIGPADHIVVISNRGVRSAAAAYALLAMEYSHVQNFTGGWNSLKK